jgi:hypothetical protein
MGWQQEVRALVATFPSTTLVNVRQGGFPDAWDQQPLWN